VAQNKQTHIHTPRQYSLIPGISTSLQLLEILDNYTGSLDRGKSIDCIYIENKNAFNTVPYNRLISKLEAYKVSEQMRNWIRNFLASDVRYIQQRPERGSVSIHR
jgi:hypothetical protein